MNKVKVGIVGGAGYTGGELLRLLLLHPHVDVAFVQSSSNAGNAVYDVHTDLYGETDLQFSSTHSNDVDVIFLCGGHGAGKDFVAKSNLPNSIAVIDLSQDFRHKANATACTRNFVYGLPELNKDVIKQANSIANPGCFATAIQLALLPLAKGGVLLNDVHINATTGSTGAGQALSATTHFSWRDSNLSVYKAFEHQHITEINESLAALQQGFNMQLLFVPQRGNFTRGILASVSTKTDLTQQALNELYSTYYAANPFVQICAKDVDLKQVVNTNRCFLHIAKHGDYVHITSVIDNLLKGASGQAVQNMNLVFGFDEKAGLNLKPVAF